MKLGQKAQGKSYGQIKEELYREVVKDLDESAGTRAKLAARDLDRSRRDLEARKRVDDYQVIVQRAKL